MDTLWAPWRMKYIKTVNKAGCFLCATARSRADKKNFILYRGKKAFCIMNKYPYNNGHLLIAPYSHKGDLNQLADDEILETMKILGRMEKALHKTVRPDGFNIGINQGRVAGAGLVGHFHVHIVPRWSGDTNFMPVCCSTKIVSQALDDLYAQLIKTIVM